MLDAADAMTRFLHLMASEPDIAKLPVMIDSSKWRHRSGPSMHAGKSIVNSISLKEGEEEFIRQAKARTPLWRRGDRHGLRQKARRILPPSYRDLRTRVPDPYGESRFPAAGYHLRPEHLPGRHRHG